MQTDRILPRVDRGPYLGSLSIALLLAGCGAVESGPPAPQLSDPLPHRQHHVAYRAGVAPVIDGVLDDGGWEAAPWTEWFVDIRGAGAPRPEFGTRAKVLWDDTHLFIGVEMEEPALWATFTERDSIIFRDKAFEVFLDPDGDTLDYWEFQVNGLGTVWDLLLDKPYSAGGSPDSSFDTPGMECAVHLDGSLNDAWDRDRGWSVELAIPFEALRQMAGRELPPRDGDVWWMNLSRVQWQLDLAPEGRGYVKRVDAEGKPPAETYWVWSPQGEVNMHKPQSWGLVMFVDGDAADAREFVVPAEVLERWAEHGGRGAQ